MVKELREAIVKGKVASFARNTAELERVPDKDLAKILREIADKLEE